MSEKNIPKKKEVILIVEDDSHMRLIIRQSLQKEDYLIVEVENGLQAQEFCRKELPNLIILDLMMPKMNGIEFMKWFRKEIVKPFIPVLMLTALGEIENKVEGFNVGADDYLVKPFNIKELQARTQALLKIEKLTNQLYGRNEILETLNQQLKEAQQALLLKERELVAVQMAGATAHNLGQPVTTIALYCRVIEKSIDNLSENSNLPEKIKEAKSAVLSIKEQCLEINNIVNKLNKVNPHSLTNYPGEKEIIDL